MHRRRQILVTASLLFWIGSPFGFPAFGEGELPPQPPFRLPSGWQFAKNLHGLSNVALAPEIEGLKTRTTVMTEYLPTPKLLELVFDEKALQKKKSALYQTLIEGATESGFTKIRPQDLKLGKLADNKGVFAVLTLSFEGLEKESLREETRYIKCSDGSIHMGKILVEESPKTENQFKEAQKILSAFPCKRDALNDALPEHLKR